VIRRTRKRLRRRKPGGSLLDIDLEAGSHATEGQVCGGRMTVWVECLANEPHLSVLRELLVRQTLEEPVLWSTRLPRSSRRSAGPSVTVVFDAQGRLLMPVLDDAPLPFRADVLASGRPIVIDGVLHDPHLPKETVLLVGAGHVGQAVAHLASWTDFQVVVVDDRETLATAERFPEAKQVLAVDMADAVCRFPVTDRTYIVIATRSHGHDQAALKQAIGRGAAYVGMIGSRRKIQVVHDGLLAEGASPERLAEVHAPIGLDIGARTVEEIGVSIVAELIQARARIAAERAAPSA
jgi:xanthine dehydrogenase accessory factor